MLLVDGVTAFYGRIRGIADVSLRVDASEIVTLIGSNEAGKSTTLMTVSGALAPMGGRIELDGEPLAGRRPHQVARAGVSHVPEGRRIVPHLTVAENLDLGGFMCPSAEFARRLERVRSHSPWLAERRNQLGGTLSGGEQQMLAIGRALIAAPRVSSSTSPPSASRPASRDMALLPIGGEERRADASYRASPRGRGQGDRDLRAAGELGPVNPHELPDAGQPGA